MTLWEAHVLKTWEPPKTTRVLVAILIEENMFNVAWNELVEKLSKNAMQQLSCANNF